MCNRLLSWNKIRSKRFAIWFGIASVFFFLACEKDDICVDGDTPLLIVTFYNSADPSLAKAVNKLRVIGIEKDTPVGTFSDRSNRDSIALPLKADVERTGFVFYKDSASDEAGIELGNPDTIYFDYKIQSVYVSRACGFVPNFEDFSATLISDENTWIDSLEVKQTRISNATSSHVSIYY